MATQKPTGAKKPPTTGKQTQKQEQRLPIKATVNWLNPKENENTRATASLSIGDAFAVHGIKVVSGTKGDFVSMPSYKGQNGYKDIFHAVTADAREQMNNAVMQAYEQKLAEQDQTQDDLEEDAGPEPENGQVAQM